MVVVRSAADVFRSIRARITEHSQQPNPHSRRLSQGQFSSNLELTTAIGPIRAGTQQLELDLELLTGAIIRIRRTFHVQQGQSTETQVVGGGDVLDMSQPSGGVLGHTAGDTTVERSTPKPGRLQPQKLVFLVIGPLMIIPVVAGLLLLIARRRQKLLGGRTQEEAAGEGAPPANHNAASQPPISTPMVRLHPLDDS